MDTAIFRRGPMRASTEELPRIAKAHQGNSGSFARELREKVLS